jgi:putative FmdB family regulatory protein
VAGATCGGVGQSPPGGAMGPSDPISGQQGGAPMPTYDFRCEACGKEFEQVLTFRERSEGKVQCPACKSERVEAVPTTFVAKTSRKS